MKAIVWLTLVSILAFSCQKETVPPEDDCKSIAYFEVGTYIDNEMTDFFIITEEGGQFCLTNDAFAIKYHKSLAGYPLVNAGFIHTDMVEFKVMDNHYLITHYISDTEKQVYALVVSE